MTESHSSSGSFLKNSEYIMHIVITADEWYVALSSNGGSMKIFLAAAAIVTGIALHANAQTALSPAPDASRSFKSAGDVFKMCTANVKTDLSECLG